MTLNAGQIVDIDPNANDPHAACVVYQGETREVLGCLYIPTTRYHNDNTIELSTYQHRGEASSC